MAKSGFSKNYKEKLERLAREYDDKRDSEQGETEVECENRECRKVTV